MDDIVIPWDRTGGPSYAPVSLSIIRQDRDLFVSGGFRGCEHNGKLQRIRC